MRPGSNDQKSTNKPSTSSPSDTPVNPARAKERELFKRLNQVKQYPISPDEEQTPTPQKP